VFTDADTLMKRNALKHLLEPFQDPSVGAVGGDYRYLSPASNSNEEKTYWNYDRLLKRLQSAAGNMTSATGQIYAIRRSLFQPIPQKLVDDFYVSVQAPSAHARLVFAPRAIAFGTPAEAGRPEFDRKVRVVTGGLRTVWRVRHILNPFRYGFYAFQLFTHKVLRRLLVIPLLLITISTAVLFPVSWFYQAAGLGQLAFHSLAAAGYLFRNHRIGRLKILSLPFFFDLVNLACLVAFFNLIAGTRHDIWKPARPITADNPGELWGT
jgi:cellulose synthase/poly-beta-1,6-N-acetylglucosamine synthase-like glycosyltransferase